MKTELIDVSPSLAKTWLEKNTRNRNVSQLLVDAYARDMAMGRWSLTHQGIAFYEDGTVADGQHRLYGVIKSECTIPFLVTFGIEKESGADIDMHKARKAIDAIKIGGLADWINKSEAAIINYLYGGDIGRKLTAHTIVEKGEPLKEHILFTVAAMSQKIRSITSAAIMSAIVKASYNGVDKERLYEFCDCLQKGIPNSLDDVAAIRLREYLLHCSTNSHNRAGRREQHLKCQRAIKAFVNREKISKLMTPSEDIYKLEV